MQACLPLSAFRFISLAMTPLVPGQRMLMCDKECRHPVMCVQFWAS